MTRYDWNKLGRPRVALATRIGAWFVTGMAVPSWPWFTYGAVTRDWTLVFVPLVLTAASVVQRAGMRKAYGAKETAGPATPAEREPLMFEAAMASAVFLAGDPRPGRYTVNPVKVTLDQAADLADDLTGGPYVYVMPEGGTWDRLAGRMIRSSRVSVTAFIAEEAAEALHQVAGRLADGSWEPGDFTAFRLRDGELVPVRWS